MDFFEVLPRETADEWLGGFQKVLRSFPKLRCTPGTGKTPGLLFHWDGVLVCELRFDEVLRIVDLQRSLRNVGGEELQCFWTDAPRGSSPEFIQDFLDRLYELCGRLVE